MAWLARLWLGGSSLTNGLLELIHHFGVVLEVLFGSLTTLTHLLIFYLIPRTALDDQAVLHGEIDEVIDGGQYACRKLATIASLAAPDRERVVETLLASRVYSVRSLVMLLKTFGALLYAGDEQIRARLRPAPGRASIPLRIKRAHVA